VVRKDVDVRKGHIRGEHRPIYGPYLVRLWSRRYGYTYKVQGVCGPMPMFTLWVSTQYDYMAHALPYQNLACSLNVQAANPIPKSYNTTHGLAFA
jgi:hypothetical protein